jgi:spermidine synthase
VPAPLASALVFVTSGAVLVLEILAGRLLAPYVGVTLETFTAIIGVVLAAIAIGTWLGGVIADRADPRRMLPVVLVLGGATAIASVPVIRTFGPAATGAPGTAVVLAALAFFVPAAVLSAASPMVVKIQLDDLANTGHVVGRLSAIGTAGALFGVFVTGFVLVAAFPTTPVVIAVGGGLVAGGGALAVYFSRGSRTAVSPRLMAGGALLAAASTGVAALWSGPCEVETAYFCARVEIDAERPSGRVLVLDTLRHSYVDLDDPTHLEFDYVATFGDVVDEVASRPGASSDVGPDVIHIGGGGFTMPGYVDVVHPTSTNLVLELDAELVTLARRELGLDPSERMTIRTGDARTGVLDVPDGSADVVLGDAFGGLAVPWHLTTREFTADIRRTLRPGGVYAINVIDFPPMDFVRAEVATLRSVFDHVALVATPDRLGGRRGGNVVVLASDWPLPLEDLDERFEARGSSDTIVADPVALDAFIGDAPVLTDEFAPVDQLLTTGR